MNLRNPGKPNQAMPPAKSDRRYQDILNKIASRGPFGSKSPVDKPQTPQDSALDLINAYDSLIPLTERSYDSILCYGPKSLRRSAWSAVVIWYQKKGYHGYQTLDLLGVWAHYAGIADHAKHWHPKTAISCANF